MGGDGRSKLLGAVEHWNRGELNAYMDLYAEHVVLHKLPRDPEGKEAVRGAYTGMWRAFPSSHPVLDDVIAEGDRVARHYQWEGRQATGRRARVPNRLK